MECKLYKLRACEKEIKETNNIFNESEIYYTKNQRPNKMIFKKNKKKTSHQPAL